MRASGSSASSRILTEAASVDGAVDLSGHRLLRQRLGQELWLVAAGSFALSLISLVYCYTHGLLLLYGDAVAHLHIARRIFDSQTPGFRQLGSVWLPLSHLMLVPFVQKMSWWQSGLAGAWPSMACYVLACVALYWLARCWMPPLASVLALAFFALNPGLLYFATTAMTEPLFLAEMLWSALLLVLFARAVAESALPHAGRLLSALSLVLVAAVFTRYDGWIYAAAVWCVATAIILRRRNLRERLTGTWVLFTVVAAVAPLIWIAYNAKQFHDPLDFIRGPYSARAIEARTGAPGAPHYPGYHNMGVATLYFVKAAELGAVTPYAANALLLLAVAGTCAAQWTRNRIGLAATMLLWIPLPFYAYSVAYGSVPIFIPVWWPFSWYNTRYGMELLPAFALFCAFLIDRLMRWQRRLHSFLPAIVTVLVLVNTTLLLHAGPLVYGEAVANSATRIPFEKALARTLEGLPAHASILMYTSNHIGAVQQAGIPLRHIVNEVDYYRWQAALKHPAQAADFVVAIDGDAVAQAVSMHPADLQLLDVVCGRGQGCARVYRSHGSGAGLDNSGFDAGNPDASQAEEHGNR
ncbi:MAG: hypothetical protein ACR2JE_05495 [Acidobacteriaceae bacterium]